VPSPTATAPNSGMAHESDPRAGLKPVVREWFKMLHEDGRAAWLARD